VLDKSSKHNLSIPTHRWSDAQILHVQYATVSKLALYLQQHNTTTTRQHNTTTTQQHDNTTQHHYSHTIFFKLLPPFKLGLKYFLS